MEVDLEVDLEEDCKGDIRGGLQTAKGTSEGTSNRSWKGTCCCVKLVSVQVQVRSGLVVWFSLESSTLIL